jgi:hypothetical protein
MAYNSVMREHSPPSDVNQTAARIVAESTAKLDTQLPADVEAAWAAWSAGVGKMDARGMALLRAAFEVGVEAAMAKQ